MADSSLANEDVDFAMSVLSKKYQCNLNSNQKLLELILRHNQNSIYPGFSRGLDNFTIKGYLNSSVYTSFKKLFERFNDLAEIIDLCFPHAHGVNWLESPLSITVDNASAISLSPYGLSIIEKVYYEKIEKIKSLFEGYASLKVADKLFFISAYFFSRTELLLAQKDPTQATVFMHRAVETLLIAWLVDEQMLTINSDGEVVGDKYNYLKDYMNMSKPVRSFTDKEVDTITRLNELRNECKFAHGYVYLKIDDAREVLDSLKNLFEQEEKISSLLLSFRSITNFNENFLDLIYSYLLENRHLVKL
ncbi:hypothetical protein [Saccharospirillum sp.]|uniref:hypothetical protein n=1 Tax=Saccharospirillum sp. TaxID=2033801 RepID=UPI0034A04A0F